MLHSKQWHYSLHRDFQNCNSTRRSPTGFFVPILQGYPYNLHTHTSYREFSIQNPILHAEDKELFEYYYYIQRAKRPSFQKRNSMHRRQGDLLEIHPCVTRPYKDIPDVPDLPVFPVFPDIPVIPDLPVISDIPVIHDLPAFQAILQVPVFPGNPPHSSILRLEYIFYIFYKFYSSIGFHRKLHQVPVGQYKLQTFYKHYILQRKGDVAISVEQDTFSRIELFLQISCHQELLITRMTFTSFSSSLSDQESTEITINTYRC